MVFQDLLGEYWDQVVQTHKATGALISVIEQVVEKSRENGLDSAANREPDA